MRRVRDWLPRRLGSLLVAAAAWVTLADGPRLVSSALLFSGILIGGSRFVLKRVKRRRRPTLDPFGNAVDVEAGRVQQPS